MNLLNLTSHDIVIFDWNTNKPIKTIKKTEHILSAQKRVDWHAP